MPVSMNAPAFIRRAFFVSTVLAAGVVHAAPPTSSNQPPAEYLQFSAPSQEEGRRVLEAFRQAGIPGEYYLEFDLHVLPRRGDERVLQGRLWGARNEQGAISRVSVSPPNAGERRVLIQNGEQAKVWCVDLGGPSTVARLVDSFEPIVPGVELTAFELQMPYIYWPDAKLERLARMRSRPTHVFYFTPPPAWAAEHPDIIAVRAYLDTQFNVPVQTELIGAKGQVLRTLSLVDLTKVGDQYIPKSIDLRNDVTRDKTRFQVTGAALNRSFPASVFEPSHLAEDAPVPPRTVRVAP